MLNGYDVSDDEAPVEKSMEMKPLMMAATFTHRKILHFDVDLDDFDLWFKSFENQSVLANELENRVPPQALPADPAPNEEQLQAFNEALRIARLSPYKLDYLERYLGPKALQWYQFKKDSVPQPSRHYDFFKGALKADLPILKSAPLRPVTFKIGDNIVLFLYARTRQLKDQRPGITTLEIIREVKQAIPQEIRQYLLPAKELNDFQENLKIAYGQYLEKITNQIMLTETETVEQKPSAPSSSMSRLQNANQNNPTMNLQSQAVMPSTSNANEYEAQIANPTLVQDPNTIRIPGVRNQEEEDDDKLMLQVGPGRFQVNYRNFIRPSGFRSNFNQGPYRGSFNQMQMRGNFNQRNWNKNQRVYANFGQNTNQPQNQNQNQTNQFGANGQRQRDGPNCHRCNKIGHIARNCRTNLNRNTFPKNASGTS